MCRFSFRTKASPYGQANFMADGYEECCIRACLPLVLRCIWRWARKVGASGPVADWEMEGPGARIVGQV